MENILYEINGVKYVLVEVLLLPSKQEEITAKIKSLECIFQGIKELHPSKLLTTSYAIIKVLVPEKNIFEFNKEEPKPERKEPETFSERVSEAFLMMFK